MSAYEGICRPNGVSGFCRLSRADVYGVEGPRMCAYVERGSEDESARFGVVRS